MLQANIFTNIFANAETKLQVMEHFYKWPEHFSK